MRALTEPQIKNCEEKITYSPVFANMKLAEFRYGKEEMLALFSPELEPPKEIITLGALYVDSCQFPLNLIQMGTEEARAWQQKTPDIIGNNTSNRAFSTGPPPVAGGRAPSLSVSSRGRGRGRAANFPYFDRNRFDDPDSENSNGQQPQPVNGGVGKPNKGDKGVWSDSKGKPIEGGFSDAMKDWRDRKGGLNENTKVWGGAGAPSKPVNGHSNSNTNWRSHERNGNTDDPSSINKPRANDWFSGNRGRGGHHYLPEWATNSSNIAEGGFDDNGKFRPDEYTSLDNVPKWTNDEKWIEEEVEPEIINQQSTKPSPNHQQPTQPKTQENKSPTSTNIPHNTSPPSSVPNIASKPIEQPPAAAAPMPPVTAETVPIVHSTLSGGIGLGVLPTLSTAPSSMPTVPLPQPPGMGPSFETIKWTYLDPQGQIQGPFRPDEMLEWSKAGYFPTDLLIKRNIDGRFSPLSEMSVIYGRNPFIPGPTPRGISNLESNEHINQQQYLHHLLMQQQQQQLLAQQQLMMFHHQSSNLNSLLLNKAINPSMLKPSGGDSILPSVVKQPEDMMNTVPMRNQNFDLSPEVSSAVPSFDPIKSLLNQLKESTNSFTASVEDKESPVSPQSNFQAQQFQTQVAPQMQQHAAPLGYQIQQPLIQPNVSAGVHISQHQQMPAMQFSQHQQQQQAATMGIDKQLQAQLASIGVQLSKPTSQLDLQARLAESNLQQTLAAANVPTEKRQPSSKQKERSPAKRTATETTPSPTVYSQQSSVLNDQLEVKEVEPIQIKGGLKETVIVSPPDYLDVENIDDLEFIVPRSNEKKEKKTRKAEVKKKAKSKAEAKANAAPYIPGLPGSQQPTEDTTPDEDSRASQERQQTPDTTSAEEKKKKAADVDQVAGGAGDIASDLKEAQTKPAPWANCKSPGNRELSLHDIQKIEAEKERKRRTERQQLLEIEQREKREIEQQRKNEKQQQASWSYKAMNNNVKSLAEIQAEEEKKIRNNEQKQSKEQQQTMAKSRKAAQRAPDKPTSWAGKIAANIPVTHSSPQANHSKSRVVAPATDGFWEHGGPALSVSAASSNKPSAPSINNNPSNTQKGKDKKGVSTTGKADYKGDLTKNFKGWCHTSLETLSPGPELDIETFLGFLQDIESPYEVNDYIKSYIGETKAHKKFGADYLERRSQLKNALKKSASQSTMDDLTSPATALGHDVEFQEIPRKGKKKSRSSKTNLNHLLGFTTAPGHGINRGELDLSM